MRDILTLKIRRTARLRPFLLNETGLFALHVFHCALTYFLDRLLRSASYKLYVSDVFHKMIETHPSLFQWKIHLIIQWSKSE